MSTDDNTSGRKRRHFIEKRPGSPDGTPVWRRAWFWLFATVILLVSIPLVPAAWHLAGPDESAPARIVLPLPHIEWNDDTKPSGVALPATPDAALTQVVAARVVAKLIATLPSETGDADIRTGRRYDEKLTPAFVAEVNRLVGEKVDDDSIAAASGPACRLADILPSDGFLRAAIAADRARRDARANASDYLNRLELARCLVYSVSTPEDLLDALLHERDVLDEVRFDSEFLATDPAALKIILPALAAHAAAPEPALAKHLALAFDAALDEIPDAGLLAMRSKEASSADTTTFERLARFSRKPNLYRRGTSALLENFGRILSVPLYRDGVVAMRNPAPDEEMNLSAQFLHGRVFETIGGRGALAFFFSARPPLDSGLMDFILKFDAFTESRDIEGVAYLSHRRAGLLVLKAHFDHTRFDAAATAYALGLRYRRALDGGKWPKDTEGIFAGLMDLYPPDPFTDEPVGYSRKNLTLHSPGADLVDNGGLPESEFATESEEFWEPTIPLEPERPTNPEAFGIRVEKVKRPATPGPTPSPAGVK